VPIYPTGRGNPVLFDRSQFGELTSVTGDIGGREVIRKHAHEVHWVEIPDARQAADIDTADDLSRFEVGGH
jgi:molybdenum cofactor cytidylyltransferase